MPRVLIPSDNRDFVAQLANAYRHRDWDVAVGVANFDLRVARYDLVHLQWPEELSGWKPPSVGRLREILARLDEWAREARLLVTVHNLRPHRRSNDPMYRELLEGVYERVHALAHFTETSRALVTQEFAAAASRENAVTGFFNFDALLPPQRDAAKARATLGFAADDFVLLVFGGLREWAELELVRSAFSAAKVSRKRLLICGRYDEPGPVWRQRCRRWNWTRWLRSERAIVVTEFIPDDEVHRMLDAADALLVPRLEVLNSGLPALAASFGKIIIAPRCGAFPELLADTRNLLYTARDYRDCARAIREAAALDGTEMAQENRALAARWDWDPLIARGLAAVGLP